MMKPVHSRLCLAVILVVIATALWGSDEQAPDNTSARKPATRDAPGRVTTVTHRGPECFREASFFTEEGKVRTILTWLLYAQDHIHKNDHIQHINDIILI